MSWRLANYLLFTRRGGAGMEQDRGAGATAGMSERKRGNDEEAEGYRAAEHRFGGGSRPRKIMILNNLVEKIKLLGEQ